MDAMGLEEPPAKLARVERALRALADRLKCPITGELLMDPVATADGHVYERAAIERWLTQHETSPSTGSRLPNKEVTSSPLTRGVVRDFVESGAVPREDERQWQLRRGLCMAKAGDMAESKRCLQRAIELGDDSAKFHLGSILLREAADAGVPEAKAILLGGQNATSMKRAGKSAVEAKNAGCPAPEIYELCDTFSRWHVDGEDGTEVVTKDGAFAILRSKDDDNAGPWILEGLGTTSYCSTELSKFARPLRWTCC
eukprot:TRINITY_DN48283_c0_g1_i1.p1 TRINITY_DN48283_c0_g1~~TRINITY_DN48283_c0_g1_i1.p1  ORF type:complete len:269 (+),score=68.52 TRINITY_DN48283_c0_g1_i1:42-809(+)